MIWLLAGYMWLYIHRPFEVWPRLGDLRLERIYMVVVIAVWLLTAKKKWISNRLNAAFAVFSLAVAAAWILSPVPDAGAATVEDFAKVGVFYVLVVSTIRDERSLRFLIRSFIVCMALYMGHSLLEYYNGRYWYRMGTVRMVGVDFTYSDPNTFAGTVVISLPLLIPLWRSAKSLWEKLPLVAYIGLTCICVALTGSRSGLIGLSVSMLAIGIAVRHRVRLAVIAMVLAPIVWSLLPEDRQNRYLTLFDSSYGPESAQLSADMRWELFDKAMEVWHKSPIWGFGPSSFPIVSGTKMEIHSLYGALLSEYGVLGAAAFAGVLFAYLKNAREIAAYYRGVRWKDRDFEFFLSASILLAVTLLLILGLSGHNLFRYHWLWYGAFQVVTLHCVRERARRQLELDDEWSQDIFGYIEQLPEPVNVSVQPNG